MFTRDVYKRCLQEMFTSSVSSIEDRNLIGSILQEKQILNGFLLI